MATPKHLWQPMAKESKPIAEWHREKGNGSRRRCLYRGCGVTLPNAKWSNVCAVHRRQHKTDLTRTRRQLQRDRDRRMKMERLASLPEPAVQGMRFTQRKRRPEWG